MQLVSRYRRYFAANLNLITQFPGLQRLCAYFEPVEPGTEYYRTEGDDYDYQDIIVPVTAKNFSDVRMCSYLSNRI